MKIKTPWKLIQKRIIKAWNDKAAILLLEAPKVSQIIKEFKASSKLEEVIKECFLTKNEITAMINNDINIKFNIKYPAHIHFTLKVREYKEANTEIDYIELTAWSQWVHNEQEFKEYIEKNYLEKINIYDKYEVASVKINHFFTKRYQIKKKH